MDVCILDQLMQANILAQLVDKTEFSTHLSEKPVLTDNETRTKTIIVCC